LKIKQQIDFKKIKAIKSNTKIVTALNIGL